MVKRVDAHPRLKSAAGPYYFSWAGVSAFYRSYLVNPVRVRAEIDGQTVEGVTALAQNSDPFTYFASRPVRVCEGVAFDDGTLALGGAEARHPARHADADLAPLQREPARRPPPPDRTFHGVHEATITSISETKDGVTRPFPVQVDGDYIGERTELELKVDPGALTIVA